MIRESTSRPKASVPSQWAADGVGRDDVRADTHEDVDDDDDRANGAQRALLAKLADLGEPAQSPGNIGSFDDGRPKCHQRNRMRGSIHAYIRSTVKLTKMKTNATSITSAWVRV